MTTMCPKCGSTNVESVSYLGIRCTLCKDCGFDERALYEVYPEEKSSAKQKGRFTPYKVGGARRIQTRKA